MKPVCCNVMKHRWLRVIASIYKRLLTNMTKHIVATVDEIPAGGRKVVDVAGRAIGIFNVNGEYFAIRNSCPHQGGPLCSGRVTGFITATAPGQYTYTRRGEIVRCRWNNSLPLCSTHQRRGWNQAPMWLRLTQ